MNTSVRFYEVSPRVFVMMFPELASHMTSEMLSLLFSDLDYIVRVAADRSRIEFGYPDDSWFLK